MIERTQTGVRIATPLLKVLKGLAEHKDMSLGDLLEGIVLHALKASRHFPMKRSPSSQSSGTSTTAA